MRVNDKHKVINDFNSRMLAKTVKMFEYKNLPESMPHVEVEKMLQLNGFGFCYKVEETPYLFNGGLGGIPDVYNNPTQITIANPALKFNETVNLSDGVLVKNDSMMLGLKNVFDYYNTLLCENYISMDLQSVNARITNIMTANNDRTKESAEKFFKKIKDGEFSIITQNAMFEGLDVHNPTTGNASKLKELIEYHQYIRSTLYAELGINTSFNMKREKLISDEVDQQESSLRVFVNDMLDCRKTSIEHLNQYLDTKIRVDFSSIWKEKQESNIIGASDEN